MDYKIVPLKETMLLTTGPNGGESLGGKSIGGESLESKKKAKKMTIGISAKSKTEMLCAWQVYFLPVSAREVVAFCPFSGVLASGGRSVDDAARRWRSEALRRFGGALLPHVYNVDDAKSFVLCSRKVWCGESALETRDDGHGSDVFVIDFGWMPDIAVTVAPELGRHVLVAGWQHFVRHDVPSDVYARIPILPRRIADTKVRCTPIYYAPSSVFKSRHISMTPHCIN
jgi:hypothetical protein